MDRLYLYHVTPRKNVPSIRKNGILINPPARMWHGSQKSLPNRVYLCSNPVYAGGSIDEKDVLLIQDLDVENLLMDEDAIFPFWEIDWADVKKEGIRKEEGKREWLNRVTCDMGLCGGIASLFLMGACAYSQNIPPTHIKRTKRMEDYSLNCSCEQLFLHRKNKSQRDFAQLKFQQKGTIQFPLGFAEEILNILKISENPISELIWLEKSRLRRVV